jgi:lipopolysaccharide biosynthesis regulator YciM
MTQSRVKRSVVPLAKKRVMRSNEMTAEIPKGMTSHEKQSKTTTKEGDPTMEATAAGFKGFDAKNVSENVLNVSENVLKMIKYSLDTTFDSLTKIQEFNDKIVKDMNKQIQANAEKIVSEWSESSKKGWDEYRKVVEKGFKQAEELVQPAN